MAIDYRDERNDENATTWIFLTILYRESDFWVTYTHAHLQTPMHMYIHIEYTNNTHAHTELVSRSADSSVSGFHNVCACVCVLDLMVSIISEYLLTCSRFYQSGDNPIPPHDVRAKIENSKKKIAKNTSSSCSFFFFTSCRFAIFTVSRSLARSLARALTGLYVHWEWMSCVCVCVFAFRVHKHTTLFFEFTFAHPLIHPHTWFFRQFSIRHFAVAEHALAHTHRHIYTVTRMHTGLGLLHHLLYGCLRPTRTCVSLCRCLCLCPTHTHTVVPDCTVCVYGCVCVSV